MTIDEQNRIKQLLQQSLPPVAGEPEPGRDLWPAVLRRMDAEQAASPAPSWAWFDGALLAGLVGLVVLCPASIPVFLYYL